MDDATLCGLRVRSFHYLPDLTVWQYGGRPPDVLIERASIGDLEHKPTDNQISLLTFASPDGSWIFEAPGLAIFRVSEGRSIRVAMAEAVHCEDINGLVLGPVFGVLFRQRNLITLRATTIAYADGAVAICGDIGIGKSATGYVLAQSGLRLMSDGVTVLSPNSEQRMSDVLSTHRTFRLWQAAVESLKIPKADIFQERSSLPKFTIRLDAAVFDAVSVQPLRHIFILTKRGDLARSRQEADIPSTLVRRLYRQLYVDEAHSAGVSEANLKKACRDLCNSCQVHILPMVGGRDAAKAILNTILQ